MRRLDWQGHRSFIEELYRKYPLKVLKPIMETQYGFKASEKMYKKHLKSWDLGKYIPNKVMKAIVIIARRRLRLYNKKTIFIVRGQLLPYHKLNRWIRRHPDETIDPENEEPVATPKNVKYMTPEPELPQNLSLPSVPSATNSAVNEERASGMPVTNHFEAPQASTCPPTRAVHPYEPGSTWPQNSTTYSTAGPSDHHVETFIPNAFSGPQVPASLNSIAVLAHQCQNIPSFHPEPAPPSEQFAPFYGYQPPHTSWETALISSEALIGQQHNTWSPLESFETATISTASSGSNTLDPEAMSTADSMPAYHPLQDLNLSPLHYAVLDNDIRRAETLLKAAHANPNCVARGGTRPLHYAAFQRNTEMVRLLLSHGANYAAKTDQDRSVLFFAVRCPNINDVDMLPYVYRGFPKDVFTDDATMAVIDALYEDPASWTPRRRDIKMGDRNGVTPLMLAAENGFIKASRMFLQLGAKPDARDHAGHTAIKYAAKYAAAARRRDIIQLLLKTDPAVPSDIHHMLELVRRNVSLPDVSQAGNMSWDLEGILVAEEVVRMCSEKDVLWKLEQVAEEKRNGALVKLLYHVKTKLRLEEGQVRRPGVVRG